MTGDTLYAWQEQEPDGAWGTIAAMVPGILSGAAPLVFRNRQVAATLRPIAEAHREASGHPVRLATFTLAAFETLP